MARVMNLHRPLLSLLRAGLLWAAAGLASAAHVASASDPFIFATFDGDGSSEQELWIYTSLDGLDWAPLADTHFRGPSGTLRDPSIIRHSDGRYYVAYTVQSWSTQSTYFNIASSTDLLNWTHVASVDAGVAGTAYTWAPEFFVDNGVVNVIVSLSPVQPFSFRSYLFTATDASLTSWSAPVAMGIGPNIIDTFVVRQGDTYHAITQNGDTLYMEHATAPSLAGPWTYVATGNWAGWGSGKEGPALFKRIDGSWALFADWYSSNGIHTATSTDLATWTTPLASVASLASKRHGTVLRQGDTTNYRLVNRHSGKVVDVQNVNTSNGALVGQWAWNGNAWQQWQFVDRGDGYHVLISRNSSKCLDVSGASTGDGAVVIQWTCTADANQQWEMVPAGGGDFNLRARHSGKCLNVVGSSVSDAALLEQRACGSAASFRWSRE